MALLVSRIFVPLAIRKDSGNTEKRRMGRSHVTEQIETMTNEIQKRGAYGI